MSSMQASLKRRRRRRRRRRRSQHLGIASTVMVLNQNVSKVHKGRCTIPCALHSNLPPTLFLTSLFPTLSPQQTSQNSPVPNRIGPDPIIKGLTAIRRTIDPRTAVQGTVSPEATGPGAVGLGTTRPRVQSTTNPRPLTDLPQRAGRSTITGPSLTQKVGWRGERGLELRVLGLRAVVPPSDRMCMIIAVLVASCCLQTR